VAAFVHPFDLEIKGKYLKMKKFCDQNIPTAGAGIPGNANNQCEKGIMKVSKKVGR
jgi:hypothetical protein